MKKIVSAILSIWIILFFENSYAATNYTLPEKMQRQVSIGSGIKGSMNIHVEGNDPLILSLLFLQDVELQFRGIKSENESHYYLYQAGNNEEQYGLTELYNHDNQYYVRSDFLPNEVFCIPGMEQLSDLLFQPTGNNPSLASAIWRWSQLKPDKQISLLDPVLDNLTQRLEIWVAQYATVSEVKTLNNGTSAVDLIYTIPMSELKKEIVSLYISMIETDEGRALINQLLNENQKDIFANIHLDYFFQEALNSLENDYDIIYTRTISTLGSTLSSMLELPLDENQMKYQSLVIEEDDGLLSFTLRGEEQFVTLRIVRNLKIDEINTFSMWIIMHPNPASDSDYQHDEFHAIRADVSHQSEVSTDEESREHQRDHWRVFLERDTSKLPEGEKPENYPEETPVILDIKLHYFSKYAQSSPTTLEIESLLQKKDLSLKLQGQMKTASPWAFSPFQIENAIDMTTLSSDDLSLKFAEFLASASEQLHTITNNEREEETKKESGEDAELESYTDKENTTKGNGT